jgi:hypothetical protein
MKKSTFWLIVKGIRCPGSSCLVGFGRDCMVSGNGFLKSLKIG